MASSWIALRAAVLLPWAGYLAWRDWKCRRIPNAWTLGGLAVAFCLHSGYLGLDGFKDSALAALAAFAVFAVPFLAGAAGAGDVKMSAACAAILGLRLTPLFLMASSFAGLAVLGAMLLARKASPARLAHLVRSVFDWRYDRAAGRANLPAADDERCRIPFGVALAAGAVVSLVLEALS